MVKANGESSIPLFKTMVQIGGLQTSFQIQKTPTQKNKLLLVDSKALQTTDFKGFQIHPQSLYKALNSHYKTSKNFQE